MNKGVRILVSIVLLLTISGLFIWLTRLAYGRLQETKNKGVPLPTPYAQVDEKAAALEGADEKPIRELADAVVNVLDRYVQSTVPGREGLLYTLPLLTSTKRKKAWSAARVWLLK